MTATDGKSLTTFLPGRRRVRIIPTEREARAAAKCAMAAPLKEIGSRRRLTPAFTAAPIREHRESEPVRSARIRVVAVIVPMKDTAELTVMGYTDGSAEE